MSIWSWIERILMAGGAVIGCIGLYFAFVFVHSQFARRRHLREAERLRKARQQRLERSGQESTGDSEEDASASEDEVDPRARAKELRERIESLHARLNVRAGAYLALNGTVLGILAGFKPLPVWSATLALAVIFANFLAWSTSSSYLYDLRILHLEYGRIDPGDPALRALKDAGVTAGGVSPAITFGQYLPVLAMMGWFVFLVVIWPF